MAWPEGVGATSGDQVSDARVGRRPVGELQEREPSKEWRGEQQQQRAPLHPLLRLFGSKPIQVAGLAVGETSLVSF